MNREDLAAFRRRLEGCELVALLDVAARTVLASDGAVRIGQENLDDLCETACRLLASSKPLADRWAMISGPRGSRVFVASPVDPEEVLCGFFSSKAELHRVEAAAIAYFVVEKADP